MSISRNNNNSKYNPALMKKLEDDLNTPTDQSHVRVGMAQDGGWNVSVIPNAKGAARYNDNRVKPDLQDDTAVVAGLLGAGSVKYVNRGTQAIIHLKPEEIEAAMQRAAQTREAREKEKKEYARGVAAHKPERDRERVEQGLGNMTGRWTKPKVSLDSNGTGNLIIDMVPDLDNTPGRLNPDDEQLAGLQAGVAWALSNQFKKFGASAPKSAHGAPADSDSLRNRIVIPAAGVDALLAEVDANRRYLNPSSGVRDDPDPSHQIRGKGGELVTLSIVRGITRNPAGDIIDPALPVSDKIVKAVEIARHEALGMAPPSHAPEAAFKRFHAENEEKITSSQYNFADVNSPQQEQREKSYRDLEKTLGFNGENGKALERMLRDDMNARYHGKYRDEKFNPDGSVNLAKLDARDLNSAIERAVHERGTEFNGQIIGKAEWRTPKERKREEDFQKDLAKLQNEGKFSKAEIDDYASHFKGPVKSSAAAAAVTDMERLSQGFGKGGVKAVSITSKEAATVSGGKNDGKQVEITHYSDGGQRARFTNPADIKNNKGLDVARGTIVVAAGKGGDPKSAPKYVVGSMGLAAPVPVAVAVAPQPQAPAPGRHG